MRRNRDLPGLLLALALPLSPLLSACVVVKPHQREVMSLRAMDPSTERVENKFRQHWQESREGAAGGFDDAGGGCGCN